MTSLRYGRPLLLALAAVLLLVPGTAAAQGPVDSATTSRAATPDRPAYEVSLRGDAAGSRWTGRQTVSFRNAARTPPRSVDVRLWGNGADGCGAPGRPSPVRVGRVAGGTRAPAMAAVLRGYVRGHWQGVATTADFVRAAQAATTEDLGPFWAEHRIHP